MDMKERERLYSKKQEILEKLCDLQKEDIRFAGFYIDEVIWKWAMIWGVLDDVFMDDTEAEVLSWLEQYIEGKMKEKELMQKVVEMRREYERKWEEFLREKEREERMERVKKFFLKPFYLIKGLFRRRELPF
jgi:hypothetical protein